MSTQNCIICDRPFATNSKGGFVGRRHVRAWDAHVHGDCVWSNRDGVVPTDDLLARLSAKGIEPVVNARGWIELPGVS